MTQQKKSPKVVYVDYEEKMSLQDAAAFLESVAKKLREEGTFTLTQGEETHEVTPAEIVELEVKFEEEKGKHQFELELEWREGDKGASLSIE